MRVILFGLFGVRTFSNSGEEKDVRSSSLNNIQKLNFSTVIILINVLLTRPFQEKKKRNSILTQTLFWNGKFSIQYLLFRKEVKLVSVYVFLGNFKDNFSWVLSVLLYCRGARGTSFSFLKCFSFHCIQVVQHLQAFWACGAIHCADDTAMPWVCMGFFLFLNNNKAFEK